jgi:hypothetical protein
MIVLKNIVVEDDFRYSNWEKCLSQRGKEVVLNCLEAGLECYKSDEDGEGCKILEELIELFNKKEA